ncbi:acetolactate decarboxylase [Corynebacterium mucifaciens]|uniref:Alpha-acetolactate decarboxylase n=1 Tax=Corynebacterium mucifaciens TaxID=57171 RepID=A0A7X6LSC5_9CORY|nr:acetolactate decarboxylase [Corynebacterium mucifaciens]NKY68900.1 acetolactate decarboxylase [Corynebacterium mucifaciens]
MSATIARHPIFQNSLMTALLDGIYDGELTIGDILSKGNFGLGTFDALDGEMLILDGVCHQLTSDGKARVADLEQRTPFTVVTNFVPRLCFDAPKAMVRSELAKFIDDAEPSHNFFTAVKITGRFKEVRVRTVTKQEKPYPPMSEAVSDDAEHVFNDVDGVIGGFRTPAYAKGIGVPGCHVHFINDDHSRGGHVLDYTVDEAVIELCPGTDMDLHLPVTAEFLGGRLSPEDLDEQLHTTEVKG